MGAFSFNLDNFRANFPGGGARPTQFNVALTFPSSAPSAQATALSQFVCMATTLPESTIGVVSAFFYGRRAKFAGDRDFAPWTVSILNDTSFAMRNALESWIGAMQSNVGNQRSPNATSTTQYFADLSVNQLDPLGNTIITYVLRGAFPTNVGPIRLDWSQQNQIETFDVTFEYQEFTNPNTDSDTNL